MLLVFQKMTRFAPAPLFVAVLLLCTLLPQAWGQDATARRQMEQSYSRWREAMVTRSLASWQQATATSRQLMTRNLIVSQKQAFPAALFDLPVRPPETATLRFLKMDINGATGQLAYFGKVDIGLLDSSEVPENLLILKFILESTGWKFDTTRLVNLASAPDVRATLKNGGSSAFLNEPEFAPTGIVPPVPKACPVPDRIGVLQIASFGYQTTAVVNGFDAATVENNAEEHIIIGGLRDGENPLQLAVKQLPIPEGEKRVLQINALVLTGNESRPTIKVYSWKPESHPVPEAVSQIIHVNRLTLRP